MSDIWWNVLIDLGMSMSAAANTNLRPSPPPPRRSLIDQRTHATDSPSSPRTHRHIHATDRPPRSSLIRHPPATDRPARFSLTVPMPSQSSDPVPNIKAIDLHKLWFGPRLQPPCKQSQEAWTSAGCYRPPPPPLVHFCDIFRPQETDFTVRPRLPRIRLSLLSNTATANLEQQQFSDKIEVRAAATCGAYTRV